MKAKNMALFLLLAIISGVAIIGGATAVSDFIKLINAKNFGEHGRQIHLGIFEFSAELDCLDLKELWPVEGEYQNSTDFFRDIIASNYVKYIDFSYFGGPGIEKPKDLQNPAEFTAENNAWGVVVLPADPDNYDNRCRDSPFLFSRNIGFGSPPGPPKAGDTIADMNGLRKDVKPFGDELCVIITYGGTVKILPHDYATQTNFNPKGETLKFIMP